MNNLAAELHKFLDDHALSCVMKLSAGPRHVSCAEGRKQQQASSRRCSLIEVYNWFTFGVQGYINSLHLVYMLIRDSSQQVYLIV